MSVSDIFGAAFRRGVFRDGERRVISALARRGTRGDRHRRRRFRAGGDAQTDPRAGDRGVARRRVDTLVDRVRRKDTARSCAAATPHEIVSRLKAEREPSYAAAPIHVPSGAGDRTATPLTGLCRSSSQWR